MNTDIDEPKHVVGSITVVVLMLSVLFFATISILPETAEAEWADTDFVYKKKITINHTKIDENLINFPILINITDNDLRDKANGGHVQSSSGYDIVFYNSSEDTLLNHEIELYTATTGTLVFWVNITFISSTVDTDFYMYYGKAGVTTNPSSTDTWDSNFVIVAHMNDSNIFDSSDNSYDGTDDGTDDVAGQIERARDFVAGNTDSIDFNNANARANLALDNLVTVELWAKCDNWNSGTNMRPFYWNSYWHLSKMDTNKIRFYCYGESVPSTELVCSGWNDASWYSLAGTYSNSGDFAIVYVNGINEAETSPGANNPTPVKTNNLFLGKYAANDDYWDGYIDEFRLSNIARNASWLSACFHSQNQTTGFLTFGNEILKAPVMTNAVADIEETTATFSGLPTVGNDMTCGFWYGNSSTNSTSFLNNVTCDGAYDTDETFTKFIPILTSGEYYYVRAWSRNDTHFFNDTLEQNFLTKPNAVSNLQVISGNATNITLSWTNATVAVTNQSTLIRYSKTGYPTITTGTECYNGTAENCVIEGLSLDTTYYFKAWTYINASGSPLLWWFSDDADSASGHTEGGLYNITIRYENNRTLVPADSPKFLNSKFWAETMEGLQLAYNDTFTTNPFTIQAAASPDICFFDWDNSTMVRSVIPAEGERNITIYVCDEPLYNETNDLNESQLFYTFSFVNDYTPNSIFLVSPESKMYLYLYNGTTKYFIHQDFFSAEDTVRVALEYGKRYWMGLECDAINLPFLQYIDTGIYQTIEVNILYDIGATYVITDLAIINLSWEPTGNGMYVNYTDYAEGTNGANINIYRIYPINGTKLLMQSHSFSTSSTSYHYTSGMGCANYNYYVTIEVDHQLLSSNETLIGMIFYISMGNDTSISWLESAVGAVLGSTPVSGVRWIELFGFAIAFLFLVSFGQINGNISLMAAGSVIIFLEVGLGAFMISMSGLAVSVGVVMFMFGIIFMYGGKYH